MNHVGNNGDIRPQSPAALVDQTKFQGAHVTLHGRLEHFAFEPDMAVTPALIDFLGEPVLNGVPVTMKMLGDRLDHGQLRHQRAIDFLERSASAFFEHGSG